MLPLRARDNLTKPLTPGMRSPFLTCWSGLAKRLLYCSTMMLTLRIYLPILFWGFILYVLVFSCIIYKHHVHACHPQRQERGIRFARSYREVWLAMWVLGIVARPSLRTASVCNPQAISPGQPPSNLTVLIFCSFYFLILPITACFSKSIPLV